MENKKSTSKPNIEYGVTYGILMILSFILIYALGVSPIEKPMIGRISSLSSYFLFPIIFIYLGITTHKKNNFGFAIGLTPSAYIKINDNIIKTP